MHVPRLVLVIHNVRSSHNVGSLIRTADGVGVEEVILSGYTPGPYDRFKRPNKELIKTALGAHESVPVRHTDSIVEEMMRYKQEGWTIVACESGIQGMPYTAIPPCAAYVCIVGNEVEGLDEGVTQVADVVAEIPMNGTKESLNVAVAGAVLLFQLRDESQTRGGL